MEGGFIFWNQPLRVSGPRGVADAAGTIRSLVEVSGILLGERLMGSLEGDRVHVWRTSPLARAGDVVEFRGTLRAEGDGSVIEGQVGFNLRTRVQFVGCLVLGLLILGVGAVHWLRDATAGEQVVVVGAFITVATLVWIYSSRQLAWKQIAFIEGELARAVSGPG